MLDSPHSFATVFCVLLLVVFTVVVVDVVVVDGSIPVPTLLTSFAAVFQRGQFVYVCLFDCILVFLNMLSHNAF